MSKELVKEALGIEANKHIYDLRPRYVLDDYVELMALARDADMPVNVLQRVITKMFLRESREQSRDAVLKSIRTVT